MFTLKLRRNIKTHMELVILSFHFPQIQNMFMFMSLGTSGNVHDPQQPLFLTLDTQKMEIV